MTSVAIEIGARVELPSRRPEVWMKLVDAMSHAGLTLERIATMTDAVRGDPCSVAFDRQDLLAALADPATRSIEISAGSPSWRVSIPLAVGWLSGSFEISAFGLQGPLGMPSLRLFAHLFDMNLVEWGLVGPGVKAMLASVPPTDLEDPTSLPGLSWVTYVSPDLAYPVDLAAGTHLEGIRRIRTHTGGALLALRTSAEEPELSVLRACSPGLFAVWSRPPIDSYPLPDGDRLLARDISPGLGACQRDAAHVALEEARRHGLAETEFTLTTLDAVDRAFAPSAAALPTWLLESWSALAGEVAVHSGAGRWRRELDPRVPFPSNLLVLLPGHVSFAPHHELLRLLDGSGAVPGQVLRERLVLSQSRGGSS